MSLAAYKDLRDHHEDRQDARIDALTASSDARLDALEDKTRHLNLEDDGGADEHHRHGRRLRATDRVTAEATGDAELEAVSGAGQNATLELRDTADSGFRLVSSAAGSGELLIQRVISGAATNAVSISRSAGSVSISAGITAEDGHLNGDLTVFGSTVLGDSSTDTVTVSGAATIEGATQINSNLAVTGSINTNCGCVGNAANPTATAYLFDTTTGTVRLGGGPVSISAAGSTTSINGGLTVAGDSVLGNAATDAVTTNGTVTLNPNASSQIELNAGNTTAPIRFFQNSGATIRMGGGGTSLVEMNKLSITGTGATLTAYLPFEHHQDIKTTPVTGFTGSHTAWTVLGTSSYPTVDFTVAEGDLITVSGNFAQNYQGYGSIGDLFRLAVRRGSAAGSYISAYDDRHVIAASGGDNSVEHGQVVFPATTFEISSADAAVGSVFISYELIRRDAGVPAVTLVAEGTTYATQCSRILATRLVKLDVPVLQ